MDDAAAAFREAITHGRNDVNFTEYLKSLGGVLGHLGRYNEAQAALEQALEQALDESRAEGNGSSNVVSARHSLAEHFLLVLRPMEAIAVTVPSIGIGAKLEGTKAKFAEKGYRGATIEDIGASIQPAFRQLKGLPTGSEELLVASTGLGEE